MRSIGVPVLALACVPVLASSDSTPPPRRTEADRGCVNRRSINAVSTLDDRHAFVKASAGDFYLFTLEKNCQEFRLARKVVIEETRMQVCGDGNTLLLYEVPTLGAMRCRIETIESVASKSAALDLIDSRREK
jgi:hypothetical protein